MEAIAQASNLDPILVSTINSTHWNFCTLMVLTEHMPNSKMESGKVKGVLEAWITYLFFVLAFP